VYYNYEMSEGAGGEMPGINVFYKDAAGDILIGAYNYLDLTPKGRNETGTMDWVRHHDRYSG